MAVRGDVSSSVADFESKMVVDRVAQDDPLGLPEVRDLGIQRFRVDLSRTKEHVVRNSWQEEELFNPLITRAPKKRPVTQDDSLGPIAGD